MTQFYGALKSLADKALKVDNSINTLYPGEFHGILISRKSLKQIDVL